MVGPVPILPPSQLQNLYPPSAPDADPDGADAAVAGENTGNLQPYDAVGAYAAVSTLVADVDRLRQADSAEQAGDAAGDIVADVPQSVARGVLGAAQHELHALRDEAHKLGGAGVLAATMLDGWSEALGVVASYTNDAVTAASEAVGTVVERAVTTVVKTAEAVAQGVSDAANGIADWVKSWW